MSNRVAIIDWYRADDSRRMRRVLVTGATCLTMGGLVIAVSFLTHQPERIREYAAAIGIVLVAGSAAFTAVRMQAILREDVSVVLRTDGVAVQAGPSETIVPWADLDGARWDEARGALILERRGAEAVVVSWRPARISGPALAARIERDKQRAAMGLLR
jgi:hypothetical protein